MPEIKWDLLVFDQYISFSNYLSSFSLFIIVFLLDVSLPLVMAMLFFRLFISFFNCKFYSYNYSWVFGALKLACFLYFPNSIELIPFPRRIFEGVVFFAGERFLLAYTFSIVSWWRKRLYVLPDMGLDRPAEGALALWDLMCLEFDYEDLLNCIILLVTIILWRNYYSIKAQSFLSHYWNHFSHFLSEVI